MMKVLVTGNLGFVGLGIVSALLDHGYTVVGFDRQAAADSAEQPNFQQIAGDITNVDGLRAAMEGCEAVVHSAIGTRVRDVDVRDYGLAREKIDNTNLLPFRVNVNGTYNVFEVARQLGLRQVVNISSAAVVYDHIINRSGVVQNYQVTADSPPNFRSHYGLTKYLQEQIGDFYAREHGFSVLTLRPWWVVDGLTNLNRLGVDLVHDVHPLTPAGLCCRTDVGEMVHLALQRPDLKTDVFYPVTGPGSERYFDLAHNEQVLGWRPRYRFESLAETWVGARATA
jgi:nucleoside-diphosphate-sugar epimerase